MRTNEDRWDEARDLLERQVERTEPPSPKLHSLLGDLYRSRGEAALSHTQYRQALDLDAWCSGAALGLKDAGGRSDKEQLAQRPARDPRRGRCAGTQTPGGDALCTGGTVQQSRRLFACLRALPQGQRQHR